MGVLCGPGHKVCGAFVGAEEEDFGLAVVVADLWVREQQVEDAVNVLLECDECALGGGVEREQNGALGPAFGDVLVLVLLGHGEGVVFVKDGRLVLCVDIVGCRANDADSAASNVCKAHVEADKVASDKEEDAKGQDGSFLFVEEVGREAEAEGALFALEEICLEHVAVELEHGLEDGAVGFLGDMVLEELAHVALSDWCGVVLFRGACDCCGARGKMGCGKVVKEHLDRARVAEQGLADLVFGVDACAHLGLERCQESGVFVVVALAQDRVDGPVLVAVAGEEEIRKLERHIGVGDLGSIEQAAIE
eukprot:comp22151_c0_seq1/m.51903 comp22151_c0_seq1/g.51903  ORF comp22151_c0_seq1/g.51903 comp22151_c0_seq1/m.51903 type:complete len:307 (+) comp22151_c0_seq1:1181-2101(+)